MSPPSRCPSRRAAARPAAAAAAGHAAAAALLLLRPEGERLVSRTTEEAGASAHWTAAELAPPAGFSWGAADGGLTTMPPKALTRMIQARALQAVSGTAKVLHAHHSRKRQALWFVR